MCCGRCYKPHVGGCDTLLPLVPCDEERAGGSGEAETEKKTLTLSFSFGFLFCLFTLAFVSKFACLRTRARVCVCVDGAPWRRQRCHLAFGVGECRAVCDKTNSSVCHSCSRDDGRSVVRWITARTLLLILGLQFLTCALRRAHAHSFSVSPSLVIGSARACLGLCMCTCLFTLFHIAALAPLVASAVRGVSLRSCLCVGVRVHAWSAPPLRPSPANSVLPLRTRGGSIRCHERGRAAATRSATRCSSAMSSSSCLAPPRTPSTPQRRAGWTFFVLFLLLFLCSRFACASSHLSISLVHWPMPGRRVGACARPPFLHLRVGACLSPSVRARVCVCVSACVCQCVFACACVCVSVRVRVLLCLCLSPVTTALRLLPYCVLRPQRVPWCLRRAVHDSPQALCFALSFLLPFGSSGRRHTVGDTSATRTRDLFSPSAVSPSVAGCRCAPPGVRHGGVPHVPPSPPVRCVAPRCTESYRATATEGKARDASGSCVRPIVLP